MASEGSGLTRREELYLSIISRLASRNVVSSDGTYLYKSSAPDKYDMRIEDKYEVGDVVMTYSSIGRGVPNIWNIAFVEAVSGYAECVLRDIFTGELCNYSNESFKRIVGIPFHLLLSDENHARWEAFKEICEDVDSFYLIPIYAVFGETEVMYRTRMKWTDDVSEFVFPANATSKEIAERLSEYVKERRKNIKNSIVKGE